jgi:hypothetical protein
LDDFQGRIPRRADRLLPDKAATIAENASLLSGELQGFNELAELADFTAAGYAVKRAVRVYGTDPAAWLTFDSYNTDVVRSPVVNDSYERYYWVGDSDRPSYNTKARIVAASAPFYLGVPIVPTAMTVTPPGGSDYTRAYVCTFVSAYGEEGQPSPPTLATGDAGTWAITAISTTVADAANRNITKKRIYRTVPGQSSALFYFVAEIDLATTSYNDTIADDVVVLNSILASTTWAMPPSDMVGWVVMPGGYLVGWVGRRLLFSEPYRPHAWPVEYELATEFDIVGLAVWGTTLVIGTASVPYAGSGVSPAAFTMQKLGTVAPCLSRRGMVGTIAGAVYPSIDGLKLVNTSGVIPLTQSLFTKKEWAEYSPSTIFAAQLGAQYIAFYSSSKGFIIDPTEQAAKFIDLTSFRNVVGIETDPYTGNVSILANNFAMEWNPIGTKPVSWRWKSKIFQMDKPFNYGAFRLNFDTEAPVLGESIITGHATFNNTRFAAGRLASIGSMGCVGGRIQAHSATVNGRHPIGGSELYMLDLVDEVLPYVRFIVYADGIVRYDHFIHDGDIHRLPSGYKSDEWQFEMYGNTTMRNVQIAETAKALDRI